MQNAILHTINEFSDKYYNYAITESEINAEKIAGILLREGYTVKFKCINTNKPVYVKLNKLLKRAIIIY